MTGRVKTLPYKGVIMYLSIGNDMAVRDRSIIGIFDLDNTTAASRDTQRFLSRAEREGRLENAAEDIPKTFVVCAERVYLSQMASATLLRRSETALSEL